MFVVIIISGQSGCERSDWGMFSFITEGLGGGGHYDLDNKVKVKKIDAVKMRRGAGSLAFFSCTNIATLSFLNSSLSLS